MQTTNTQEVHKRDTLGTNLGSVRPIQCHDNVEAAGDEKVVLNVLDDDQIFQEVSVSIERISSTEECQITNLPYTNNVVA